MPSLKRSVGSAPDRTGFETYAGPDIVKQGLYEGVVKQCTLRKAASGNLMFNVLVELDDKSNEYRATTVGFPAWGRIVLVDKEANLAREKAFYRAITGNQNIDDVNVIYDGDDDAVESRSGAKVTKIGGKSPIGVRVKADIRDDNYEGQARSVLDSIYPLGKPTAGKVDEEVEETEEVDESVEEVDETEDEATETEQTEEQREAELKALGVAALRKIADTAGLESKGVSKADLISSILDEEFGEPDEESDDEDEDEEEDEEETTEVVQEPSAEEKLRANLAGLDRAALKALIKGMDSGAKFKTSQTDDDLRDLIVSLELSSDEDEDEEDDEAPF